MATLYAKAAGGNWSAAGTWSNVNSAGIDSSGPPTNADDVIFELGSGNVTIDAAAAAKSVSMVAGTGDYAGTLTHNAFTLSVANNITFSAGMTYSPVATSLINTTGTSTFITAGKLLPSLTISSVFTYGDNFTFMSSPVIALIIATGSSQDLNGKTVSGNSVNNRLFIRSNVMGSARTITLNGGTFANCDFRDITASGAIDLSAASSGDCGGNTNITFTTAANKYWVGNGGNYSDSTNHWATSSGGSPGLANFPLPQDDVFFDANSFSSGSQAVAVDVSRLGKSINFTGATNSPTLQLNQSLNLQYEIYGSLTLIAAMTLTHNQVLNFVGRGSFTLTSAGNVFAVGGGGVSIAMLGGALTLQDAYSQTANSLNLTNGTFNANNFSITANAFVSSNSNIRTIIMGSGTWTLNGTGNVWNLATNTNLTFDATGSTILLSNTAANAKNFNGGSQIYNLLQITGGGSGAVNISGSNTFANLPQVIGGTKTLTITAGTTQTFTGGTNFGNGTNVVTINTGGAAATFTKPAGDVIDADFLNLTNIQATETNKWYAGNNSVDGGGNTNWIFTAAPRVAAAAAPRRKKRTLMGVGL